MRGLRGFWRRGALAKLIIIGGGAGVLVVSCCVLLLGLVVLMPSSAQQARSSVAPTAQMLVAVGAPAPTEQLAPTELPPPSQTPGPTDTPAPTQTPPPTATPEPTPTPGPQVVTLPHDHAFVIRTGPGTGYPALHVIAQRQFMVLATRNERGTPWYHIQINSLDGWTVIYDLDPAVVARLPIDTSEIAPPPPTATVRPTATPEPIAEPPSVGVRAGAVCRDGTRSSATGRGACSHHGGVDHWLYR